MPTMFELELIAAKAFDEAPKGYLPRAVVQVDIARILRKSFDISEEKAVEIAFDTVNAPKLAGLFDESKEKVIAKRMMDKLLVGKA